MPIHLSILRHDPPTAVIGVALHIAAVLYFTLILTACVVPLPEEEDAIHDEQLLTITPGETTKAAVEAELGKPDVLWPDEHVFIWEEGPTGAFIWVVPAGYTAFIAMTELGKDIVLIQFDEADIVQRIDRRPAPLLRQNYGDFLREWLAEANTQEAEG